MDDDEFVEDDGAEVVLTASEVQEPEAAATPPPAKRVEFDASTKEERDVRLVNLLHALAQHDQFDAEDYRTVLNAVILEREQLRSTKMKRNLERNGPRAILRDMQHVTSSRAEVLQEVIDADLLTEDDPLFSYFVTKQTHLCTQLREMEKLANK
jgi:hypothetical protein